MTLDSEHDVLSSLINKLSINQQITANHESRRGDKNKDWILYVVDHLNISIRGLGLKLYTFVSMYKAQTCRLSRLDRKKSGRGLGLQT